VTISGTVFLNKLEVSTLSTGIDWFWPWLIAANSAVSSAMFRLYVAPVVKYDKADI
jgi:hypothetical protein